jgi:hypothetical protein
MGSEFKDRLPEAVEELRQAVKEALIHADEAVFRRRALELAGALVAGCRREGLGELADRVRPVSDLLVLSPGETNLDTEERLLNQVDLLGESVRALVRRHTA